MKKTLLFFLSLLWAFVALAQPAAPPAELAGKDLRLWLVENWYTPYHQTLGYDGSEGARGRMYNFIDNNPNQNKVVCVYAGYEVSWTYGGGGTNPQPINCEHTVPQSFFGYNEPMKSDIHHLFPTYGDWNSERSNFPFAEIDDTQTQKWMYLNQSQTGIPSSNINAYSEFTSTGGNRFEPREDHKGNVARAIFYFYTMYEGVSGIRPLTDVANPATLYQWHLQDPVDAKELERNNRIATYQGNRNPFIDHPASLAKAWGFAPACENGPTVQVSNLVLKDATHTSFTLSWTNGNRDARLVVVREGAAPTLSPNGTYTGISPDFGQATDQGGGNKLCFAGGGSTLTLSGLSPLTTYYVQVYEYCSATQQYLTTAAPVGFITTAEAPAVPVGQGWMVSSSAAQYTINFDQTLEGINQGQFAGAGFDQLPTAGQLDSDSWSVTGLSDGEVTYGGSFVGSDFGKGASAGNVTSGGLYAFEVAAGNYALGFQPTGDDFTPGALTLRFKNTTGEALSSITLYYQAWVRNDQPRANSFNFSHSSDGSSFTEVPELDLTSAEAADGGNWQNNPRSTTLSGLSIPADAYYYLRWSGNDVSGSGSRDEFALDNIRMTFNGTPMCMEPAVAASSISFGNISSHGLQLNWTRGDGSGCLVLAREGAPVDAHPEAGVSYSASAAFGEGDELGQGNFVVYSGTGSSLDLSNLRPGSAYHFAVYEWGCSPVVYLTSSVASLGSEVLGVQEAYSRKLLALYPNPTTGKVTLQAQEPLRGKTNLQLHNLQGAVLFSASGSVSELNLRLNEQLDKLAAGTYLLLVQDQEGKQALRLIKQ